MKYFPLLFLLPLLTLSFPLPTTALSSKTYSFNSQAAFNYTTTGPITYTTTNATTAWYHSDWQYRQQITINKDYIGEELTDFPVAIRLGSQSLVGARDDRHDLIFTSADGTTKLSHEIESSTDMWVKVPQLTPIEDTVLYVYYGNPTAIDQQNTQDVWTNGYVGVWHMNQDPSGVTIDSTDNKNNGNGYFGPNAGAGNVSPGGFQKSENLQSGKIGSSYYFDGNGVGNHLRVSDSDSLSGLSQLQLCSWIKWGGEDDRGGVIAKDNDSQREFQLQVYPDGNIAIHIWNQDGQITGLFSGAGTSIANSEWHHVCTRWDNQTLKIYLDNNEIASTVMTGSSVKNTGVDLVIGARLHNEEFLRGNLDQVTLSRVARTPAWIQAEYANQANHDNFLTISPTVETHLATGSGSTVTLKSDRSLNYTSLNSFTPNGSLTNTYQLSPDNGKTWYYYAASGWLKTTTASSSANDITNHLNTFPTGTNQLLWKAFIPSGNTLDSLTITYTPSPSNSLSGLPLSLNDPRIQVINELHRQVFGRPPTFQEWLTYVNKLINGEKQTAEELLGSMEYARLFGS
jgi:hypothetical protein